MVRTAFLAVAALALVAAGVALFLPDPVPPRRVWALETTGSDGLPLPVRIAAAPGGAALDDFEESHDCGGAGMGGNVIHFLKVRRGLRSRLRDFVREPPLATLGYGRRNHVLRAADGEWRELVRKEDDGTDPPVAGGAEFVGAWEHVAGDGVACTITFRPDGGFEFGDDEGQGDWTRSGTKLVLALVLARGGAWPSGADRLRDNAVCDVAPDGNSYAGTDHAGRPVSGRRAPPR